MWKLSTTGHVKGEEKEPVSEQARPVTTVKVRWGSVDSTGSDHWFSHGCVWRSTAESVLYTVHGEVAINWVTGRLGSMGQLAQTAA